MQFFNDVQFSAAAIALIAALFGALAGAIMALWRANNRTTRAVIAAKDAHIAAQSAILIENTLALKGVMGTIGKLDEHLELSKREQLAGAQRSREEHAALLDTVQRGQENAANRQERIIEKLTRMDRGNG